LPGDATSLKIEYNYISQDYPDRVDSQFNDMFYILIDGERVFLHKETVNSNSDQL
tara:strand:+ start:337 stop:501 length:165 start_codon:yes stop_codon:yes gene_type:complete